MPRLSTFYGLIIHMPGNDHDPPHFHVEYAESSGRILVRTGELLPGSTLPRRALRLVEEWRRLHVDELSAAWDEVRAGRLPAKIEPLP